MNTGQIIRGISCLSAVLLLIGATIYLREGLWGFKALFDFGSLFTVSCGTFLLVWAVYPFGDVFRAAWLALSGNGTAPAEQAAHARDVLIRAANCAVTMGTTTCVMGFIVILLDVYTYDFLKQLPGRMAMMVTGPAFGSFLSEMVFIPLAKRMERQNKLETDGLSGGINKINIP